MEESRWSRAEFVSVAALLMALIGGGAVTTYRINSFEAKIESMEDRLVKEIQQVDLNSSNRRNDSHSEMIRLHELQGQQIRENRDDIRDIGRKSSN